MEWWIPSSSTALQQSAENKARGTWRAGALDSLSIASATPHLSALSLARERARRRRRSPHSSSLAIARRAALQVPHLVRLRARCSLLTASDNGPPDRIGAALAIRRAPPPRVARGAR